MRRRDALDVSKHMTDEELVVKLEKAFERTPLMTTRDLRAQGLLGRHTIAKRIGSWSALVQRAGADPNELRRRLFARTIERKRNARDLGQALAERLQPAGHSVAFNVDCMSSMWEA